MRDAHRRLQLILAALCSLGGTCLYAAAPYGPSPVIAGFTLDWTSHVRLAPGSDNWPMTWADDDHQYTSWGDGGGFGGDNTNGRVSLGVGRVEGAANAFTGYNIWGGYQPENPAQFDGKSYGMLSVGGILYMWVSPGSEAQGYEKSTLYTSANHGATWTANWAFNRADGLVNPTFLQFGKDYAGAKDNYVYIYANHIKNDNTLTIQTPGEITLMRVPKDKITDRAAYEFFVQLNGDVPQWTATFSARKPVFADANGVGWNTSATYNAGLGRYFLITEHTASIKGNIGMHDAPQPWGPWTTVYYGKFGEGHVEQNAFFYNFSNKWASNGGKDFILVFSGINENDSWNSVAGSFLPQATEAPLTPTGVSVTIERK